MVTVVHAGLCGQFDIRLGDGGGQLCVRVGDGECDACRYMWAI